MCDGAGILNQFKNMFSGDYAAIADNLTRELMVIFVESPEDRETIKQIYAAGKCAKDVADDAKAELEGGEEATNSEEDPQFWDSFQKSDADIAADAAKAAAACTDNVDRYKAGKIGGKLFASFWGQQLNTN